MKALDARTGQLLWEYATDGLIWGPPSVKDDAVYFGPFNRSVYAVDAHAGTLRWRFEAEHDVFNIAVADDMVYASHENGPLVALATESGEVVWSHQSDQQMGWPAIGDGMVYVGTEAHLLKLDARTGRVVSRIETGLFYNRLVLADGILYASAAAPDSTEPDHAIYALDPATGQTIWSYETSGAVDWPRPEGEVVYVGSEDGYLHALNSRTGELRWRHRIEGGDVAWGPATLARGIVYFGSAGCCAYALDADTGQLLWRFETDGLVSSPAVSQEGWVYLASTEGSVYALLGSDTDAPPAATAAPSGVHQSTPEVQPSPQPQVAWREKFDTGNIVLYGEHNGLVFARSTDHHVHAFSAEDGREHWRYYVGEQWRRLIIDGIPDGVAYVTTRDAIVRALDASSGDLIWTHDGGEDRVREASTQGGITYLGLTERILALDTATGEKMWSFPAAGVRWPEVTVADGDAYLYDSFLSYGKLYAVDAGSGRLRWEFQPPGPLDSPPTVVRGYLYVRSGGKVYAIDTGAGEQRWMYDADLLRGRPTGTAHAGRSHGAPIVVDGVVYVATTQGRRGEPFELVHSDVHALDAASGRLVWHRQVDGIVHHLEERGGALYFVGRHGIQPVSGEDPQPDWESYLLNGYVNALDLRTGDVLWQTRTIGNPRLGSEIRRGAIHVHSFTQYAYTRAAQGDAGDSALDQSEYVTALSGATGQPVWSYQAPRFISTLTTKDRGLAIVSLPDGWVYALDEP